MLPQTRVRPATISAMPRVVILTSLKLILGRFVGLRKSKRERENSPSGASVVALSLTNYFCEPRLAVPVALRVTFSLSNSFACDRLCRGRGGDMTFAIHASDGHITQTLRIDPEVAVAKARDLLGRGWEVHITDQAGRRYRPEAFDEPPPN